MTCIPACGRECAGVRCAASAHPARGYRLGYLDAWTLRFGALLADLHGEGGHYGRLRLLPRRYEAVVVLGDELGGYTRGGSMVASGGVWGRNVLVVVVVLVRACVGVGLALATQGVYGGGIIGAGVHGTGKEREGDSREEETMADHI